MTQTDKLITNREYLYCEKRFKNLKRIVYWLWSIYILIVLVSLPFIFLETPFFLKCFGFGLLFIGLAGAVYFKMSGYRTKFIIDEQRYFCQGNLKSETKYIAGKHINQYYINDNLLMIPSGIEMYWAELVDKYRHQIVSGQFGICRQTTKDKVIFFYTPLQLEDDLCIDQAIQKHGKNFLRSSEFGMYYYLAKFVSLPFLWFFICFGIFDSLDLIGIMFFFLIPGWFAILLLYPQYFPLDNSKTVEKLRC